MSATPRRRLLFQTLVVCLAIWRIESAPDKLSPGQKAPAHAKSSAGRALALPTGGLTPANTGRLKPSAGSAPAQQIPEQDGVQKSETVSFKEVNGETVRVVVGDYAFQSPEGLPVSFKYMADENGNKASFTIGKASAGGSGSKSRPPGGISGGGGGGGAGGGGVGGGGGDGGRGGIGGAGGGKGGPGGGGGKQYLPPN